MLKQFTFLLIVISFIIPNTSEARHNRGNYFGIDRSDLDNDIVEDFAVPILFGFDALFENYGDPRDGGSRSHEGQDIFAPKGAPIVSPTEAIVTSVGTGDSAGKYVYTANPGGESFRYMHLDEIADLKRGDKLAVGDFIGTVGDTGNAPDGVYHLHFEVRDSDGATDPFPRLTETFTLKEKMSFMDDVIDKYDGDEDDYAEYLVKTFNSDFKAGLRAGYDLPDEIIEALEDIGIVSEAKAEDKLANTLGTIPVALTTELKTGDNNVLVSLLQIYLIYTTEGVARNNLKAAGPTGYYGSITAAAVRAYQADRDVSETGVYDAKTRTEMLDHDVSLNLN